MIKIVSKFFVVLFIFCFVCQNSFAKCGMFDFYCKRVGEENSVSKSVNNNDKKSKKIIPTAISDPILSKLQRTRKAIELKKREKNIPTKQH